MANLCGFDTADSGGKTLGKVRERKIISEAIVAIPQFRTTSGPEAFSGFEISTELDAVFERIRREEENTLSEEQLNEIVSSTDPIYLQTKLMSKYVLPPEYDYFTFGYLNQANRPQVLGGNDTGVRPLKMYIFELKRN